MMFIEINDGFSIKTSAVEAVEKDGTGSKVYALGTAHKSRIPYSTLLSMLKNHNAALMPDKFVG